MSLVCATAGRKQEKVTIDRCDKGAPSPTGTCSYCVTELITETVNKEMELVSSNDVI